MNEDYVIGFLVVCILLIVYYKLSQTEKSEKNKKQKEVKDCVLGNFNSWSDCNIDDKYFGRYGFGYGYIFRDNIVSPEINGGKCFPEIQRQTCYKSFECFLSWKNMKIGFMKYSNPSNPRMESIYNNKIMHIDKHSQNYEIVKFNVVKTFSQDPADIGSYSFIFGNMIMAHGNYTLYAEKNRDDPGLFRNASFFIKPAINGGDGISLVPANFPDRYVLATEPEDPANFWFIRNLKISLLDSNGSSPYVLEEYKNRASFQFSF